MNGPNSSKIRRPRINKLKIPKSTDSARKLLEQPGPRKPVLPPIGTKKDQESLEKIKNFIDKERKKTACEENVYDEKRFSIYSTAFDKVIDHSTAYKDMLADIKREYEECISAVVSNRRESVFARNKVKEFASLPTTIAGYSRRKMELEEKLEILNKANEKLETELFEIQKTSVEPDDEVVPEFPAETPRDVEERRPIPGLTVEQWTDVGVLQDAVSQLDHDKQELFRLQRSNYVTIAQKHRADDLLRERIATHDELGKSVKLYHKETQKLRVAQEALMTYRTKKEDNPGFKQTLGRYVISKLVTHQKKEEKAMATTLDSELPLEDDDPSTEKEAELMLEYIEKFNELFGEEKYEEAAVHAANSPRGVLRSMETLRRFESASVDYDGTPTPLLLFAIALMNSSSAQCQVADREMSVVCAECALRENRPDLVKHWATSGCITSSNEIASSLVSYSKHVSEYKSVCLVVAHKMFADVRNHHDACVTLYHLNHFNALVDYAREAAEFTKNEYLDLIKSCPDGVLVMNLCRPYYEVPTQEIKKEALPLRFDQAICAMIDSDCEDKESTIQFLTGLYTGEWFSFKTNEKMIKSDSLHSIVYEETDGNTADDSATQWAKVMRFCDKHNHSELSIEIQAAMAVKKAICSSLIAIGQAGKEEFDYYT